jgi:hypothetical protein
VKNGIESTSIVDSLWQPDYPISPSLVVFFSFGIFNRFTLFVFSRGRQNKNEGSCGTGNMLNAVKRPDIHEAEIVRNSQLMNEFSEHLRVGFQGNKMLSVFILRHGFNADAI